MTTTDRPRPRPRPGAPPDVPVPSRPAATCPRRPSSPTSGPPTRAGPASSGPTPPRTSSGCAAASWRSTRWPGAAPSGCGSCWAPAPTCPRSGAMTGNQAVQMVRAGLEAVYLSGWQVAADANLSGQTYPDQSLYPANSVPAVVRRINNALLRADQIAHQTGDPDAPADWLAPIVADAEAGFGGPLNAFELMKQMIARGRRGRALGGPARLGEEVRPPGRQGPRPHPAARPHPQRGPAGGRRVRHPHPGRRPHRRPRRRPAHQRRRRAGPGVLHRRAHAPRASTGSATGWTRSSAGSWPTRRTPT